MEMKQMLADNHVLKSTDYDKHKQCVITNYKI